MARTRPTANPYAALADPRCPHCRGGAYVAKVSATFGTPYRGICLCVAAPRLPKRAYVR